MQYRAAEKGFIRVKTQKGMRSRMIEVGEIFDLPEGQAQRKWMLPIEKPAPVAAAKKDDPKKV